MTIPRKIMILGTEYTVRQKAKILENRVSYDGLVDYDRRVIYVCSSLKTEAKMHTFLHEVFHAVLREAGISQGMHIETEESVVECLSSWVTKNMSLKE